MQRCRRISFAQTPEIGRYLLPGGREAAADSARTRLQGSIADGWPLISRSQPNVISLAILKRSQRAWVSFRDAECEFQAYWTKGRYREPRRSGTQCMATLTQARVKRLEAYVNCEEGDMTCPPAE